MAYEVVNGLGSEIEGIMACETWKGPGKTGFNLFISQVRGLGGSENQRFARDLHFLPRRGSDCMFMNCFLLFSLLLTPILNIHILQWVLHI